MSDLFHFIVDIGQFIVELPDILILRHPHPLSRNSVGEILRLKDELILDPCFGSLNATCI
jgi:hypothetical protein